MNARAVIQWATVVAVAGVSWVLGQANLHILNFPLFVGTLFAMGVILILVVAATAVPSDLDDPDIVQKAADK